MKSDRAIYIRFSKEISDSYSEQLKVAEEYLGVDFLRTCQVYSDTVTREGFYKLIDDINAGRVKNLYCSKIDRMDIVAGDLEAFINFMSHLDGHSVHFRSLKDDFDNQKLPRGCFEKIVNMINSSKAFLKSERVRLSLKETKNSGRAIGRPSVVQPSVITDLRAKGYSIRKIAVELGISPTTVQTSINSTASSSSTMV